LFDKTSRYYAIEDAKIERTNPDGTVQVIAYKRRRFLPPVDSFETMALHSFKQSDRLDIIASRYLGDPAQFWQICDANGVMCPDELEQIGRTIRIAMPKV
jgi:hypothetical protein